MSGIYNGGASSEPEKRRLGVQAYTVGWVCALPIEYAAATMMLDEEHEDPPHDDNDTNIYTLGRIFGRNIVIVCLPAGLIGSASATAAAIEMKAKFPRIQFGLLVGIGGGAPSGTTDIRLGDVVVSQPHLQHGGVVQYDFGKQHPKGFLRTGHLNTPPKYLLNAVSKLISNHIRGKNTLLNHLAAATSQPDFARKNAGEDILFEPTFIHVEGAMCENCKIQKEKIIQRAPRIGQEYMIHYGTIASGSSLIRDAQTRDRGVCDYADSHKNKLWQPYAAAIAAACAKELLSIIPLTSESQARCDTVLHSDSIFLQPRLLVREDILSFLTGAINGDGSARVVLHGLPGIGKSTMARYFAYQKRDEMTVLWITASSKETMAKGFEQYARQIRGDGHALSQPVSIIRQFLSKSFDGRWLLILDGLDDTTIDVEQYIFNGLPNAKILVTTRHTKVASHIGATYVLQVNSLNQNNAQQLLSQYINPISTDTNLTKGSEPPQEETNARAQLVAELGGLPLAISIIGAALRDGTGVSSMNCQTYLKWPAEVQAGFLAQDPEFSSYPYSVWNAFKFAFERILSNTEKDQHVSSTAFFIASCESARNIAEYLQLYRQISKNLTLENIDFLKDGYFELAIQKLVATNMVTCSLVPGRPPHIEMHSLVRGWIGHIYSERIHSYTASKIWLMGFHIYDSVTTGRVKESRFAGLVGELDSLVQQNSDTLHESWKDMPDIVFPLLLVSQKYLLQPIDYVPAGNPETLRFSKLSEALQPEINAACHSTLKGIDWGILWREFIQYLEYSARFNSRLEPVGIERTPVGLEFYPSSVGISNYEGIGALIESLSDLRPWAAIGHTNLVQGIKMAITAEMERSIDILDPEAVNQACGAISEGSDPAIHEWMNTWILDVEEVLRRALRKVFTKCPGTSNEDKYLEHPFVNPGPQDPLKPFFAVLYQAAKVGAGSYLESTLVSPTSSAKQTNFLEILELMVKGGFGSQGKDILNDRCPVLEEPVRLEQLRDYIAKLVVISVSKSFIEAAQIGFTRAFERLRSPSAAKRLANAVFSNARVTYTFLVWGSFSNTDNLDLIKKPPHEIWDSDFTRAANIVRSRVLRAMKTLYGGQVSSADAKDSIVQAVYAMHICRTIVLRTLDTRPQHHLDTIETKLLPLHHAGDYHTNIVCAHGFHKRTEVLYPYNIIKISTEIALLSMQEALVLIIEEMKREFQEALEELERSRKMIKYYEEQLELTERVNSIMPGVDETKLLQQIEEAKEKERVWTTILSIGSSIFCLFRLFFVQEHADSWVQDEKLLSELISLAIFVTIDV
ncbi:hypothetical protein TWF970_007676 [Orbilia oligospora]|uniref:NB-ARC domain-containing protein n=1 Tax=Orbilia oligospora TaxID=2813651 RepID=A0A7C8R4U3_ORBOL|nr:hypothetical protein TWF970_007676 [Orbilia oligospora]